MSERNLLEILVTEIANVITNTGDNDELDMSLVCLDSYLDSLALLNN